MANRKNKALKGVKALVKGLVKKTKKARGGLRMITSQLDAHAISAAEMLADPCNASLAPGCYTGDQGFKTRLVRNISLATGAGITSVAVAYYPGSSLVLTNPSAGPGGLTPWINNNTVGGTYLTSNAASIRSLGACVSTTPNAANLAVSGQVFSAIVPASALNTGSSDTLDNLTALCQHYGKVTIDGPIETKFIPASGDENYNTPGVVSDASDQNVVLQVFVGLPAASGITCRFTNIVEWKPLNGLALVTESFLGNPSRNTIEHVKEALRKRNPRWYTNVGSMAFSVIRGYATGGMLGAAGSAMNAVSNFK